MVQTAAGRFVHHERVIEQSTLAVGRLTSCSKSPLTGQSSRLPPDPTCMGSPMTAAQSAAQPEPTAAEVAEAVADLLAEVEAALSSDRWTFLDTGSDEVKYRLYDAAALRHCCLLLEQIAQCVAAEQDLAVHILGRAHLEAWLFAMYLHFGRQDALTRITQDTRKGLEAADHESREFNDRLAKAKKQAEQKLAKVTETNAKISQWNKNHPDKPPKPFVEEPHIPALMPTGLDLSDRIADFGDLQARALPVSEVVGKLTKLGAEQGFAREEFTPLYLIYRMLSSGATHPTLNVYDSYFVAPGSFVHVAPRPVTESAMLPTLITALYSTAYLAGWVLGDADWPAPVAHKIRLRFEPDPGGQASWAPTEWPESGTD
jgi:hypothetical protein